MAKPMNRAGKTLSTIGEICSYLNIGKDTFRKLIQPQDGKPKFPARKIYGRWFANIDLIDQFVAGMTLGDDGDTNIDETEDGLAKCDKCGNYYPPNGNHKENINNAEKKISKKVKSK